MAVAAYASVLSLSRVVDNIQHPSHLRFFPDTKQIDALREKLCSLQDFFEDHSSTITEDIKRMAREIPKITYDAEILIDNYVVDQLYKELQNDSMGCCNIESFPNKIHGAIQTIVGCCNIESFRNETRRVMQEMGPINEALIKTLRTIQHDQEQPRVLNKIVRPQNDGHSLTSSLGKNKMVGFEDQLNHVLEKLTGNQPKLVIVPIIGMGGIGKTTLARSLFDHPYNLHHFHVRIWLTISQDYSVKRVLQGLLKDGVLADMKDKEGDESEAELITQLYQKLFGQRYLIVLDDVWSEEAWVDLKRGFPDNGRGSRVMVTTRLSDIANSLDSGSNSHSMKLLDEENGWNLFSEKAFEQGGRSHELEEIGREISKRCNGLPLMLAATGGLLANSNMTIEHWQNIKENINSFANSANDEYCSKILSSYHHLPIHLKPCFLYMRHYDEDSAIKISELIERWVSEGFVKPLREKTLAEAARKYLEDLIGRNMLLLRERDRNGNIKVCSMHDLLRDLCIKESNKEQFLELPKTTSLSLFFSKRCAICNEHKMDMTTFYPEILGSVSEGKILICSSCESTFPEFARLRFVMAVDVRSQRVLVPTTCRSIQLSHAGGRGSISAVHTLRLIWNLEILDIRNYDVELPKELWEMPQLRQVKAWGCRLPDPVSTKNNVTAPLQKLKCVENFKCTEEIVRRIQNVRVLGIRYGKEEGEEGEEGEGEEGEGEGEGEGEEEGGGGGAGGGGGYWSSFYLQNLAHLQKLESLSIISLVSMDLKNVVAFPCSLKKLSLRDCKIAWDDMTIIGSLPNLQVLRLRRDSVVGEEWSPTEGKFLQLKYLELERLNLVHWRVNETHFPALETLVLERIMYMESIPREIGELPSLKSIYLLEADDDIIDSAETVVEEQLSNGNDGLVLHVQRFVGLDTFYRWY